MRKMATIRRIKTIEPIPGADRIEKAIVDGWHVVVGKGIHNEGDEVIFCEIDSAIPVDNPRLDPDGSLAKRGTKTIDGKKYHVLKTARLRKVYSQGLILPLDRALPFWYRVAHTFGIGFDVDKALGIFKYDPADFARNIGPKGLPANPNIIGPFPVSYARKSDSERVQNLGKWWEAIQAVPEWEVTEKIDGQSVTLISDRGAIRVASRNYEVAEHAAKDWAERNGFLDTVSDGWAIQGEWAGPGVQGNSLDLSENRFFAFDAFLNGKPESRAFWPDWALDNSIPVINNETVSKTPDELLEHYDGIKSAINPKRLAEGVVYRTVDNSGVDALGGRSTFKVISNKWLMKNDS